MAKDPAFLFYHHDFLIGTAFMTNEEIGVYIRILCYMADKGSLTFKQIKNICGDFDPMPLLIDKFKTDGNDLYYHKRLSDEVEKRKSWCESRKNNRFGVNQYSDKSGHMTKHMSAHMVNRNENINENIIKDNKKGIVKGEQVDFFQELKKTYDWVDMEAEIKKMKLWISKHPGRKLTEKFAMNWLNKVDRPLIHKTPEIKPSHGLPEIDEKQLAKNREEIAKLTSETTQNLR